MFSIQPSLQRCFSTVTLKKSTNQVNALARYAIDFLKTGNPSTKVVNRIKLFHKDATLSGVTSLAAKANAPSLFKNEAYQYVKKGAKGSSIRSRANTGKVFGSSESIPVEKALVANISAMSELSTTGTIIGYGADGSVQTSHNDFYPAVIIAAHQNISISGDKAVKAMILLDEIRGRLLETSILSAPIDPVLYGAIASTVTYGALVGATAEQIESAIGIIVTHHVPYIPTMGRRLTDSIKAAAAMTTEAGIISMKRGMSGFAGPTDVFRKSGIFKDPNSPDKDSNFDLTLTKEGVDFSIMKNNFRIGLYSYHAAGAIEGILKILSQSEFLRRQELGDMSYIKKIRVKTYQVALEECGSNQVPSNRHIAAQSIPYIVATILRKKFEMGPIADDSLDALWKTLMLKPSDYSTSALEHPRTRELMDKIVCEHGGEEYDENFPEGIPTSVKISFSNGEEVDSKLVLYPAGHAKNTESNIKQLLDHKFSVFGEMSVSAHDLPKLLERLDNLDECTNSELQYLYSCQIKYAEKGIDILS